MRSQPWHSAPLVRAVSPCVTNAEAGPFVRVMRIEKARRAEAPWLPRDRIQSPLRRSFSKITGDEIRMNETQIHVEMFDSRRQETAGGGRTGSEGATDWPCHASRPAKLLKSEA
ncbi:hypothetical protein AAFF_G00058420 [Aldrovandia affinis]|uniref:Uncharacterized protein n=1 Tax=Aldrovandia affinis TaxID=143900 RepID=A0AAD7S0C3_9TELE|nr:hypothetical protein AAFF_G00058420 [Aldrovandia affinis]